MAAKLYRDLTTKEKQARDAELTDIARGATYSPFDLLGAPVDIVNMAMGAVGVPVSEKPFLGSEYLIDKYADLGEAIGVDYQRPTGSQAETVGRLVAGVAGVGGEAAALAGGISKVFRSSSATKTRGSGIEKKGVGSAQREEPVSTIKAYKMFKKDKDGNLHPLFVKMGDKKPLPIGQWTKAEAGELNPKTGKVKSSLGDLAYRPGFHAGDTPSATHIGGKVDPATGLRVKGSMKPNIREDNQVWAEVEMPADVDWQSVADSRAVLTKKGTPDPKTAHITDEVPFGGYYRYKTNPNMQGNWLISGQMKINRVLDDDEVTAINEAAGTQDLPRLSQLMAQGDSRSADLAPVSKKEVLEGDIVGEKTAGYEKLQKEMEASSSSDLRSLKGLKMELKGVEDAFSLNAGVNIDKSLEFASSGDSVRYTSDDFIAGVQDSFEYARDQGIDRGEALLSALRENVDNFNDIYPDALDLNSVLSDISKNVNDDFGFDKALSRFQQGQANRSAMEAELSTSKAKAAGERAEAQSLRFRESLGITKDTSPDEAQRIIMDYANSQQSGIAGAGIPDPTPPKPNLRLVKKAAGGKVDLRSGIGDIFKVYS